MDDMPEELVVAFERKHDAVLQQLRHTANTFGQIFTDGVRLLEVVMRIIDEDRNTVCDVVLEGLLYALECFLGVVRGERREFFAALIEVDVEMRRLNVAPIEVLVLDLVLAEDRTDLRVRCPGKKRAQDEQQYRKTEVR